MLKKKPWVKKLRRMAAKPDELRASTRIKDWWDRVKKAAAEPEVEKNLKESCFHLGAVARTSWTRRTAKSLGHAATLPNQNLLNWNLDPCLQICCSVLANFYKLYSASCAYTGTWNNE